MLLAPSSPLHASVRLRAPAVLGALRAFRALGAAGLLACSGGPEGGRAAETAGGAVGGGAPAASTTGGEGEGEAVPVMLNAELPFRYPPALYAGKVQGNVTLRLYIDGTGTVVADSTVVAETSGYPALDSAAIAGTHELRFRPAFSGGAPVGVVVLFPVFFRHPEASPLPGDTILKRD